MQVCEDKSQIDIEVSNYTNNIEMDDLCDKFNEASFI